MWRWVILACSPACTWITDAELAARSDLDGDGVPGALDCDDGDPEHDTLVDWYRDVDGDGFGDGLQARGFCRPPDEAGWSAVNTDCDDGDPAVHPEAREVCNAVDDDCDGLANDFDPDLDPTSGVVVYPDGDGDSAPREAPTEAIVVCVVPDGYALPPDLSAGEVWDCDDTDPGVFPGATEVCNDAADNDCDGAVDEDGPGQQTFARDADQDGFPPAKPELRDLCAVEPGWVPADAGLAIDCDDGDARVNPDAVEIWYDGTDQDCDGNDLDQDGDGVPLGSDCDDLDETRSPLLAESWYDGIDQDCDGNDDDQDGDGFPLAQDCDDLDVGVNPATLEIWYDGTDQDCDGNDDDQDGDGAPLAIDCDDTDPVRSPLLPEVWYDGVDQDCAGGDDFDQDGDGFPIVVVDDSGSPSPIPIGTDTDCDDGDPLVHPGAQEVCGNQLDDDCDGQADDFGVDGVVQYVDADFDGFPSTGQALVCSPPIAGYVSTVPVPGSTLDCDDGLATVRPDAVEVWYDGIDQDCDGNDDDQDGDGDPRGSDCVDTDPDVSSISPEWCDDIDHDCDGDPLPTDPMVTGVRNDRSLDDLSDLASLTIDGAQYQAIQFCHPGPWEVEIQYDPAADLTLRGYAMPTLLPKGGGILAPSLFTTGTGGSLTLVDLELGGRGGGVSTPAIDVGGLSVVVDRVRVTDPDRTLFFAKIASELTLIDLFVQGGAMADGLVFCSSCTLDVQGGVFSGITANALFQVSGSESDASFRDVQVEDVVGTFLLAENGAIADVVDATVLRNTATSGPAIRITSGAAVDVEGSWFEGNQATITGGAVHVVDLGSTLLARDTVFVGNDGGSAGGAVAVEADGDAQLVACDVFGNAAGVGGAVSVDVGFAFSDSGVIAGNRSTSGEGGAFWVDSGTLVSASDRVTGNTASADGGGAFVTGSAGVMSVTNGFYDANFATGAGGGLAVGGRASLFLSSQTSVSANEAATDGGVYIESVGTFGSVDTLWGANRPDDFQGQIYDVDPQVLFCAGGQPCLTY